jgi:hypothetical protein
MKEYIEIKTFKVSLEEELKSCDYRLVLSLKVLVVVGVH